MEQADPEEFNISRQKLNAEAGIVVANHPGYYDTFLIFNALKRKDVKIVVSKVNYDAYASLVGEEYIIKATDNPSGDPTFLKSIKSHIESGGLVIMYPTGGADRVSKENKDIYIRKRVVGNLKEMS